MTWYPGKDAEIMSGITFQAAGDARKATDQIAALEQRLEALEQRLAAVEGTQGKPS